MLDVKDPDQLTYSNALLGLTVLGGIRLEGLDRMRVTLKVSLNDNVRPPVRHNLDLYNDNQLEKFIRKCAEKLEVGTSLLAGSFAELTELLEKHRLEKIKEREEEGRPKARKLTEKEKEAAKAFLSGDGLLQRTNELIGKSGVIGEENNRLLMYLIFTSRKRERPLHVVSLGSSGTGKTHLQSAVGELVPEEERVGITTLSENAFYYFGKQELRNKLILIEDLDGAENALYPLRELQTKKRIVKLVPVKTGNSGETKTKMAVVEGPVCVAGCTTKESIYEDNANRSFLLYLDEGRDQDQRIMEYQRRISSGEIDFYRQAEIKAFLQNTQRMLEPISIRNPYAKELELPRSVFKPRRTNDHYLQFIEAVTFYHQHQRETHTDKHTGEMYIEVTIADIENANTLLKEVLLRKSDELSGSCRNYLENLKAYLKQKDKKKFTALEVRRHLRVAKTTQWRWHKQLMEGQLIKRAKAKDGQSDRFELVNEKRYGELRDRIQTVLDECLDRIKTIALDRSTVPKRSKSKVERSKAIEPAV